MDTLPHFCFDDHRRPSKHYHHRNRRAGPTPTAHLLCSVRPLPSAKSVRVRARVCVGKTHFRPLQTSKPPTANFSEAMCGIFALLDPNLSAAEIETLTKLLTKRLHHRGPDEVGYHGGPGYGLGHARLSIMDPAGGHQPLIDQVERRREKNRLCQECRVCTESESPCWDCVLRVSNFASMDGAKK